MAKPKRTSKVKLTNKSSSKKVKTKAKMMAIAKTKNQNNRKFPLGSHSNNKKNSKEQVKIDYTRETFDNELDTDEAEFSDEEMKNFVPKNMKNMTSFLGITAENSVASFEKVPRALKVYGNTDSVKNTVELLPIKSEKGLIKRTAEKEIKKDYNSDDGEVENEDVEEEKQTVEPMSVIEVIAQQREEINKKKLEIAQHSLDIVENPQANIGKLKQLLLLCSKDEPSTIRKLSILSLLEIFKDIVPSYRIRELSDEERTAKISKDVRKVREYEDTLLRSYQKYLQVLDETVKECLKMLKKRKKLKKVVSRSFEKSLKIMVNLSITSLKCLADLLNTLPYFNFRSNIINALVPNIDLSQELLQGGELCFNAIKAALNQDFVGDVALEIIRVIHNLTKSKNNLKPKVLEVLLYLQLDQHLINATEQKGNKIERLKEKREAIRKMSKKERKRKKVEDKLNKELQEAEAVENRDKIGKKHTEILKFLFVIYFRVLKTGHKTALLPAVLKGLAKFSHLINVDFFGDLMSCLETLLQSNELNTEERLHCILTALKVLSGQGEVLTIDPRQFYSELYNVFLNVTPGTDQSCFESMKECLNIMLIKRRKQVSSPQVFGFLKRISTVLLQLQGERLPETFLLVRSIFQLYDKCDYLLDNENFGRGVFQPEIANPEHCNAESTALWEFSLLTKCYEEDAEKYCKHILDGAPSSGNRALPMRLIQRQLPDSIEHIIDDPVRSFQAIPSIPPNKKKKRDEQNGSYHQEFLKALETSEDFSEKMTEKFLRSSKIK